MKIIVMTELHKDQFSIQIIRYDFIFDLLFFFPEYSHSIFSIHGLSPLSIRNFLALKNLQCKVKNVESCVSGSLSQDPRQGPSLLPSLKVGPDETPFMFSLRKRRNSALPPPLVSSTSYLSSFLLCTLAMCIYGYKPVILFTSILH